MSERKEGDIRREPEGTGIRSVLVNVDAADDMEPPWETGEEDRETREYEISMMLDGQGEISLPMKEMGRMITLMISPVLEQFGAVLEKTNQAIERIAASNQLMNDRIGELERQVRIQRPVSKSQEKYISDAIRGRAREMLDGKGCDNPKAVNRLAGVIRKSVLARYGIGSLREVPAYDYEIAMEQAKRWNDPLVLRDVVKEFRKET